MASITGTLFTRSRTDPLSVQTGQNLMSICFFSVMLIFFNGQTELTIAVRAPGLACSRTLFRSESCDPCLRVSRHFHRIGIPVGRLPACMHLA